MDTNPLLYNALALSQVLFCHERKACSFGPISEVQGEIIKTIWSTDQGDVWQSRVLLAELRVWAPISYWFLRWLGTQKGITHCSPQIPMTTLKFRFPTSDNHLSIFQSFSTWTKSNHTYNFSLPLPKPGSLLMFCVSFHRAMLRTAET